MLCASAGPCLKQIAAFNSNPMLTSAMLAEKEAAKAKKLAEAAKSK